MKKIDIVFCFDENQWMQAGVAMASLLLSSKGKCSYNIYCIISDNVLDCFKSDLEQNVKKYDNNSTINFIKNGDKFNKAYTSRHLSTATYFRLQIHKLLPNLDKIIYCDVDTIFCKDLVEMDKIDIGDNLIGGVLDVDLLKDKTFDHWYNKNLRNDLNFNLKSLYGYCINAGILIMNLKQIRKSKVEKVWDELLKYKFFLHDQDILNISCYNSIKYIDPKYNVLVHTLDTKIEEFNCHNEYKNKISDSINNPTIIHYTSKEKPWLCKCNKFFENWWYIASKTIFYNILSFNYLMKNLKDNVQADTYPTKYKHFLFGIIPYLTSKTYKNKTKYYLFDLILILKIKKKESIK